MFLKKLVEAAFVGLAAFFAGRKGKQLLDEHEAAVSQQRTLEARALAEDAAAAALQRLLTQGKSTVEPGESQD